MNKKLIGLTGIIAILAIVFGIYVHNKIQKKHHYQQRLKTATIFSPPRPIVDFSLIDNQGNIYTNQNLLGHWTLMFFGFTHCGHICPTIMMELKRTVELLKTENLKVPQVILVSIDPQRDTVTRLNQYVTSYDSHFIGLTGSQNNIDTLVNGLNILVLKVLSKNHPDGYDIDHSGTLLLINPNAKLAAIFSMPHQAFIIAHDFNLIQKYDKH